MNFSLFSLSGILSPFQEKNKTLISEINNGDTLSIQKGRAFSVRLPFSPGTGYDWELSKKDPFYRYQRIIEESSNQMPCAPSFQVFTIRVLKPGFKGLTWYYKRSWEKESLKTFRIYLNIQ